MGFLDPLAFALVLPWVIGWLLFSRGQRRALRWVRRNVAKRFRAGFSVHSARSLRRHLRSILTMGLLLIAAVARPHYWGETEVEVSGSRVLLILDASASMYATDVKPLSGESEAPHSRLQLARAAALAIKAAFPDQSFGLASYSGRAVIHLPITADHSLVEEALNSLEVHGMYQNGGSSLTSALDLIFAYRSEDEPNLQVVMIGDGELPFEESYDDSLAALAETEIPVHTVGVGSTQGQGRLIYDFRDVVAKKEEPTVLREYTTRRVDRHFRRISKATGGHFGVASTETLTELVREMATYEGGRAKLQREGLGWDLSGLPLLLFLVYFLLDSLVVGHRKGRVDFTFDIERLAGGRRVAMRLVGLLLAGSGLVQLTACGTSPRARAHRENEQGIAHDAVARHEAARPHYERSREYRVRPEVPIHNLGRSVTMQEDFSQAHDLFQQALEVSPELPEAHYNDGVALFEWGEAERDPRGCELERTRELWIGALQRFEETLELTEAESELDRRASGNREYLLERLEEIDALIADPPPECEQQSESESAGGGGEDEQDESGGGGGGGGDEDDPSGGGGEDEEDPSSGGGGGENDEEDPSGGGGGEDEEDPSGGGGGGQDEQEDSSGGGGSGDQDEEDEGEDPGGGGGGGGDEDEGQDDPSSGGGGGGQDEEEDLLGGGGSPQDDPGQDGGGGGMSDEELEQVGRELERIAMQRDEEGKFHRRTGPEQFPPEHWQNPDEVIWW